MPEVAFVMSASQRYALRELATTLGFELERQAVPSALHLGGFPEARPNRVFVLLDPSDYVAVEGHRALPDDPILKRTVFLCTRRLPAGEEEQNVDLLGRAGAVFVLDQRSVAAAHRAGIPARLIRPGYSESLDHFDHDAPRPVDVMFLGAHSDRRTRFLSRYADVLSRHNCLLQISDDHWAVGDTSSYLGQSRWSLLAQTKVVLNLHCGAQSRLEWQRVLDAVHAGAVVVTEHSSGIAPLVAGEHLVVASGDSLAYVADALLRDEQRLGRLRAQAYERLRTWIPYALPVSVLRAAVVELVGEPVPPGVSLGTPSSQPAQAPPEHSAPARSSESAVGEDPELRRVPGGTRSVKAAYQSPAWGARRAPLLTVITALGGEHPQVAATLASLARSRLRDFELVLVDGGAGDETRRVMKDWMQDHPHIPARLIETEKGARGAARNVGLDFARGSLSLILDAGQQLFPRCLDVLAGTLQAMPDVEFVYPIQEVTGAPDAFADAGGDYLLSFLGWDPSRLRRGNHIHAPVLIRTSCLRALGGFATDPRLDGFEDYDLWCRVADRGWRGQLVPQELARRVESGSSRTLSTINPLPGPATSALTERAPALLSGAFPRRP